MPMDFTISNLRPEPIEAVHQLIEFLNATGDQTPLGFEPGFRTWLSVDPDGIFVALSNESNEVIGCICGVAVSETQGYIGLQKVRTDWEAHGVRAALWDKAKLHLGDRNVGFCLPYPDFATYCNTYDIKHHSDWRLFHFLRPGPISHFKPPGAPEYLFQKPLPTTLFLSAKEGLKEMVIEYDTSIHGYDRSFIMSSTLSEFGCVTRVFLRDERVVGYLCMKAVSLREWSIGPMYADDYEAAHALLYDTLSQAVISQPFKRAFSLKFPHTNNQALRLMQNLGFQKLLNDYHVGYSKFIPDVPVSKIYSIHSESCCIE